MTFSIMTLSRNTLSVTTFSIKGSFATLSITTFNIKALFATLSINDTQHNNTSAIMLSVILLNVAFYLL